MLSSRLSRFSTFGLTALLAVTVMTAYPPAAYAGQGDCSQPVTTGTGPTASDCLFILQAAVGSQTCTPQCICDPSGDGSVTATDALICLKVAVGQDVELNCPCVTTTTSSTTITTSTTTTSTTLGMTTTTIPVTTTTVRVTTTTVHVTTTTAAPTTTTVPPTTTTTLVSSSECPTLTELTIVAGTRDACATNADCPVGTCDTTIGRCQTVTELDTGWTGIAHDADLTDNVIVQVQIDCPSGPPVCGVCNVLGIDPSPGYCRCDNDNRTICDEPFQADADDCGGATCNCYIGPPLALSAGNTHACVVNKFAQDVSGTVNVDSGEGESALRLRSIVYTGGNALTVPCPYCAADVTAGDGVRDGTCVGGANDGQPCDDDAFNQTFPAFLASLGDGHSLDCFPDAGTNVSGLGLIINLDQTTGDSSLGFDVECGFPPFNPQVCPCGICSDDSSIPCSSNADCDGAGECALQALGKPSRDDCGGGTCIDAGGGEGVCDPPRINKFCDGISRANGNGFISCSSNADCDVGALGFDAGGCTVEELRECFLDPIVAGGAPHPVHPVAASIFCIPPTSNDGINSVAGLPGPGRVINQGVVRHMCTLGDYVANVGCP